MNKSGGLIYKARSIRCGYYLTKEGKTLDDIKAIIDSSNQKAVKLGYPVESWQIVKCEWQSYYADNGMFIESHSMEQGIMVYPEEV